MFNILKNYNEKLVFVGAGNYANYCQQQLKDNYVDIWNKIAYFMDDNYLNIKYMSKDVCPIVKDSDENTVYVILSIYLDACKILMTKLLSLGIPIRNIIILNKDALPILNNIINLTNEKFYICELGAAGNTIPINTIVDNVDKSRYTIFGFDPDENECKRKESSSYRAYPSMVDEKTGNKRKVYQIKQNGHLTFYPPNLDNMKSYKFFGDKHIDFALYDEFFYENTISLDDWKKKLNVKEIDYMYINVDSAEFHVLKGARQLLKKVSLVEVEVYFNHHFISQPLYGEVDTILRNEGFQVLDFYGAHRLKPKNSPFNFNDGLLLHMNAIYYKPLENIASLLDYNRVLRQIGILEIKGFNNLAFSILYATYKNISKNNKELKDIFFSILKNTYEIYSLKFNYETTFNDFMKKDKCG
ncbi:MAG: FkbM family methyltransferase [Candidatus Marinarcus sp.]|uniref:FkbM family methyltransferase n=1 Tax=Candidatus Marinarcus sp. TaxID=3100987 RepID=UPI003AFFF181